MNFYAFDISPFDIEISDDTFDDLYRALDPDTLISRRKRRRMSARQYKKIISRPENARLMSRMTEARSLITARQARTYGLPSRDRCINNGDDEILLLENEVAPKFFGF